MMGFKDGRVYCVVSLRVEVTRAPIFRHNIVMQAPLDLPKLSAQNRRAMRVHVDIYEDRVPRCIVDCGI